MGRMTREEAEGKIKELLSSTHIVDVTAKLQEEIVNAICGQGSEKKEVLRPEIVNALIDYLEAFCEGKILSFCPPDPPSARPSKVTSVKEIIFFIMAGQHLTISTPSKTAKEPMSFEEFRNALKSVAYAESEDSNLDADVVWNEQKLLELYNRMAGKGEKE